MLTNQIYQASFQQTFIAKLYMAGFRFEIEPERGMLGHYVFQKKYTDDRITTIWIGIDFQNQIVIDCLYQNFYDGTFEKHAFANNTTYNVEILKNFENILIELETNPCILINELNFYGSNDLVNSKEKEFEQWFTQFK